MDNNRHMEALKIDLLKEMASIGAGNAVTALSQMLGDRKINMDVPRAEVVPLQELPDFLGDEEQVITAICFEARSEKLLLSLLFVLSTEAAENMISLLIPSSERQGDMDRSALMEVGTVVAGSYLSAISAMTDLTFMAPPPSLAKDMAGAIMATIVAENRVTEDSLILLKTSIHTEKEKIDGNLLILPDSGSMDILFKMLGV